MERQGHEDTSFFTGTEVEHTPAYGMDTLFVVGVQPTSEITARLTKVGQHIYFGANQSFPKMDITDTRWAEWEKMIQHYLNMDYICTLDIDVSCVEGLLEGPLCEYHNFIPMISVKLPYIQQLGYNATIKLDDKDFKATNPGVWCHQLHNLKSRDNFTDWSKYTQDKVLG
jgi:hypothetical protein